MILKQNIAATIAHYFDARGGIEVEFGFGMQALAQYQQEMLLHASGIDVSKIWAERKAAQLPTILSNTGSISNIEKWQDVASMDFSEGSLAILNLSGVMRSDGGMCHYGMDELANQFFAAYQNPKIAGAILRAGTGGGESLAGSRLQAILKDAPKPVTVFTDTILASAGVRGAVTANQIIASDGAQIGSIGTYISLPKGYADFYAKYYDDIYADDSENKNSGFRALVKGDMSVIKAQINKSNTQFLTEVSSFRDLKGSEAQKKHTLSGAMFNADEARKRGLVDSVGSFQFAISQTFAMVEQRRKMTK